MVELSFVSKAKSAFHSAAAKAERVLVDLKSERGPDKESPDRWTSNPEDESHQNEGDSKLHSELRNMKWRPAYRGIKQDWQDRIKNIRIRRKEVEETDELRDITMAVPFYEENLYTVNKKYDLEAKVSEAVPTVEILTAATIDPTCPSSVIKDSVPPSSVLRQLAMAVEAGRKTKSMEDFTASTGGSSPVHDRAGLRLSAVKALVLREKEDKLNFNDDEKVLYLINSLFDPEGEFFKKKINYGSEETDLSSFPRDIHGAPPESLVAKLAEVIGNFKNLREMALFWCRVVVELRKLWSEEQYLPRIPLDEIPDLKSCLLYQQLQVINCCISRKRHHVVAAESMDSMLLKARSNIDELVDYSDCNIASSPVKYARLSTGEFVVRLGADCPAGDLMLLETGEPVYSPVTQEGPLLTEDLIEETEEFVLQTRSVGAACSQLLSDMQAFKAANPGCIMEDFVRWHSPPDWKERETSAEAQESLDGSGSLSNRGSLSLRMQKEGNLWRELWEAAKPVPAVKQAPLF
ncbi:rab3 GTPase-activating protein catalytic subunit-like, partial [Neltuma alba]|uniref:rab3 GTPase-activating protein catalytic subunit-like n=1 Tax=Neltuma alba TaxID=207710 RepID=UPI0010A39149